MFFADILVLCVEEQCDDPTSGIVRAILPSLEWRCCFLWVECLALCCVKNGIDAPCTRRAVQSTLTQHSAQDTQHTKNNTTTRKLGTIVGNYQRQGQIYTRPTDISKLKNSIHQNGSKQILKYYSLLVLKKKGRKKRREMDRQIEREKEGGKKIKNNGERKMTAWKGKRRMSPKECVCFVLVLILIVLETARAKLSCTIASISGDFGGCRASGK